MVDVNPRFTINKVKEEVEKREGISKNKQNLYLGNTYLEDNNMLCELNIKNESTLTLLFQLIGGGRGSGTKKGGKKKKRGKKMNRDFKRDLEFKSEGQEYAKITDILGDRRVKCFCYDGKERIACIRGRHAKRLWMNKGDTVLISLREFQDTIADILIKYMDEEVRNLKIYGEIPEFNANVIGNDCSFAFEAE